MSIVATSGAPACGLSLASGMWQLCGWVDMGVGGAWWKIVVARRQRDRGL